MEIISKKVIVKKSIHDTYDYLSKFENFGSLMPDSIQKFEADDTSFMFQLKGLPEVRVVLDNLEKPSLIQLKSASSKLDFTLSCHISAIDDHSTEAYFQFLGNFNMMMRMMIEKPLTNFLENLADKLGDI